MNDHIRKKTKVAVAIVDQKNPLPKCEKLVLPTLRAYLEYPVYRKVYLSKLSATTAPSSSRHS